MQARTYNIRYCLILFAIMLSELFSNAQVMESKNLHLKDSLSQALLNISSDPMLEATLNLQLTELLKVNGEYIESNARSRHVLTLVGSTEKPQLLTSAYSNLAEGYTRMGLLDSSFYFANAYVDYVTSENENLKSIPRYELLHLQLEAYSLLATFHFKNKDPNQSLAVINIAKDLIESINLPDVLNQYPKFRYGQVYSILGQLNYEYFSKVDAFFYFNRYIEESGLSEDVGLKNSALYWRAYILFENKRNLKEAFEYTQQIDVHQLDPLSDVRPWDVYWLTGMLYRQSRNDDFLREYAIKSVNSVLTTDAFQEIIDVLTQTSIIARHLRDYSWALNNRELTIFYKDYLIRVNNGINVRQLEVRLENELELSILNNELSAQKSKTLLIIIGAILILALNVLIFRNLRLVKRAKRFQNAANEKLLYEKEVAVLKKEKLASVLEFKQRQLATSTLASEQLNSQMTQMIEALEEIKKTNSDPDSVSKINALLKVLKSADNAQDSWNRFYKHFENVHPNFFGKLLSVNDGLTQNDLRHCAYVQMSLSNKEVAHMYNVDPNSVKMARYRLKKKLHLDQEESLQDFIFQLTSSSDSRYLREA